MPERVLSANEVSVNGKKYRIVGPVKQILASAYAPKQVFGDYGPDNRPDVSVAYWNDWRGGVNLEHAAKQEDMNRAFWSDCYLRSKGHLVPATLTTLTAAPPDVPTGTYPVIIGEVNNVIYAAYKDEVRSYTNSNDTWSANLDTLPAQATDVITITLGGTTYLIFAHTGGYTYSSDAFASAGTDDTTDTLYMAWWDDRLWGIDAAGQLWYSTTIGTEVNDALLPLRGNSITALFVGPDANGDDILYVSATDGLYAHDVANTQFVRTKLRLPRQPNNGKGATTWRGNIYYPAGMGIYEYNPVAGTLRPMGLDRDAGIIHLQESALSRPLKGQIVKLVGTHNDLIAAVDIKQGGDSTGQSSVLGWDGQGWQLVYRGNIDRAMDWMYPCNAYSVYRLWVGDNQRVTWLTLDRDLQNPDAYLSYSFSFATNAFHATPWFTAGDIGANKLGIRVRIETKKQGTVAGTPTVKVYWQQDYSYTRTTLGTINVGAYALTEYNLGDGTNPVGKDFKAARITLEFSSSVSTYAADVLSVQLDYRKKLPAKWGFEMTLSLQDPYGGQTVPQMRSALITAVEASTFVELTYKDDSSSGNPRNYYVDTLSFQTSETTGHEEKGEAMIVLMER